MIIQVTTVKETRGRLIAGTDSGFTHMIRPVLYNAYHHIINLSNPLGQEKVYDVTGNICETGDIFAKERTLPEIRENDYLAILNTGAYGRSMAGIYNLRPIPSEAVFYNDRIISFRKSLKDEELADAVLGGHYGC